MSRGKWIVLALVLGAVAVAGYQTRDAWQGNSAVKAQAPARVVSVAAARGLTKTAVLEAAVQWLLRTPGLGAEGGARPGRGAEAGHGRTGGR